MTPPTIGSSVSSTGTGGTSPRKMALKSTLKKGSAACGVVGNPPRHSSAARLVVAGCPAARNAERCVRVHAPRGAQRPRPERAAHLDRVREGDGHVAQADVGEHVAEHVDDGQRVDALDLHECGLGGRGASHCTLNGDAPGRSHQWLRWRTGSVGAGRRAAGWCTHQAHVELWQLDHAGGPEDEREHAADGKLNVGGRQREGEHGEELLVVPAGRARRGRARCSQGGSEGGCRRQAGRRRLARARARRPAGAVCGHSHVEPDACHVPGHEQRAEHQGLWQRLHVAHVVGVCAARFTAARRGATDAPCAHTAAEHAGAAHRFSSPPGPCPCVRSLAKRWRTSADGGGDSARDALMPLPREPGCDTTVLLLLLPRLLLLRARRCAAALSSWEGRHCRCPRRELAQRRAMGRLEAAAAGRSRRRWHRRSHPPQGRLFTPRAWRPRRAKAAKPSLFCACT